MDRGLIVRKKVTNTTKVLNMNIFLRIRQSELCSFSINHVYEYKLYAVINAGEIVRLLNSINYN